MAGEGAPTLDWGPLLTSTLMTYIDSGKLHDQVFNSAAVLRWLRSGKRIKMLNGGERIKQAIMYDGSGNFKRYNGDEVLNPTPSRGMTTAFFNWKQAGTMVVINGLEKRSNGGEAAVLDLAKSRVMQSEMTLADNLATDVLSDGTADGSKQITGFSAMVPVDPTTGTYADINSATNTAWRSQTLPSIGAGAVNLVPNLRALFNDCSEGQSDTSSPDAIFTTQAVHEIAESTITPAIRYSPGGDGEMSINPVFRGAEIQWDSHIGSGLLYALNSNHVFMFVHKDANLTMDSDGFVSPYNADSMYAKILFQGNMGTNNRRKLGQMSGITG
jgi:hypothetical protein